MKIYILADMEGISGIRVIDQVRRDSTEYAEGRELMMADINAAVGAAFDAGADQVVACDTHGGGGQIRMAQMDPRAVYETPNAGRLMPALDESFDGVVLLGHHARAGTRDAFLDHTMSSVSWFEYRLNDQVLGEIGIEAAWAGHYGVPVIAVSGDEAAAREAREVLGDVECAVVKWGIGRSRARCLPPARAHEEIRSAIARAMGAMDRFQAFAPCLPASIQLTFNRSDMADDLTTRIGLERVDARTVRRQIDSLLDVVRW
jgi:D-amino peptidase